MTDLLPSGPAQAGELLDGRYRLEELIGEGGMGSVWRASDETLGRTVAIKVFWAGTTEDSDAVRRESEKRLLASLSHPSLVTLFDAQLSQDERSYLVMEHIDGGTLASRIEQGPIAPLDAASLAADLGEALHVVHEAGIVHRDVKPANILLRPPLTAHHTFRAVLADFGIAYLVDTARVTTPGMAIGTAAYISPEQVRGHAPTPASDIYSLGLVLLEALSGRRAFPQRAPGEAIAARLSASPVISGEWGYGWRSMLSAMTAIEPSDRPTALEVAMRGRALDSEDADTTQPASEPPRPQTAPADQQVPESGEATRVLATPATAATELLADEPASPTADDLESPTRSPRRRHVFKIAAGAAAVIVAAVLTAVIWTGISSAPSPQPQLPQLEEPLNTDLQNLLDEVTP